MLTRSQHHRHADTIAQLNPNQPTHNPRIRQNNPTHPENVLQPNDRERKNQKSKRGKNLPNTVLGKYHRCVQVRTREG